VKKKKSAKTADPIPDIVPELVASEIREFMSLHRLDDLVIESDQGRIEVRSGTPSFYAPVSPRVLTHADSTTAAPAQTAHAELASTFLSIRSPMAGTFYRAPSPSSTPYVQEGDRVSPSTTVCIIEAMKVMNEIKADVSGKIVKICLESAASVESGAVLFEVDPNG